MDVVTKKTRLSIIRLQVCKKVPILIQFINTLEGQYLWKTTHILIGVCVGIGKYFNELVVISLAEESAASMVSLDFLNLSS